MPAFARFRRHVRSAVTSLESMSTEAPKIFCVVVTYWCISISLVFANKYLVGNNDSEHDVSLFVAWIQCIVTVLFIFSIKAVKAFIKQDSSLLHVDLKGAVNPQIMMLTCTYVGMLTFNNLCLRNVGIAFYQVARSLTLIFVVIMSLLILKKQVSWRIWACCLTVAGGFVLGVDQENLSGTLSISGVFFGVITSLFVSLNGIFTKKALDVVERDSVQLTLLNNLNAMLLFVPFLVGTGQINTVLQVPQFHTSLFWGCLVITGVLAFSIAWISAVQIDLTSPVTHHISANSKAVLQTVIAVVYSHDHKPILWWFSVLLVVAGALAYAVVRIHEEKISKMAAVSKMADAETGSGEKLLQNGHINGSAKPV